MGDIAGLFSNMQWYVYVPLIIAIVLLLIEGFIPDFGLFGITGIVFAIGGIVTHGIVSKSIAQVFILILLMSLIAIVSFMIFVRSAKYGFLGKTPIIENKTAVPVDYSDKRRNVMRTLLGKTGTAITNFKPVGKFELDKVIYEGITNGEMIEKGETIRIVDVEGIKIRVERKNKGERI